MLSLPTTAFLIACLLLLSWLLLKLPCIPPTSSSSHVSKPSFQVNYDFFKFQPVTPALAFLHCKILTIPFYFGISSLIRQNKMKMFLPPFPPPLFFTCRQQPFFHFSTVLSFLSKQNLPLNIFQVLRFVSCRQQYAAGPHFRDSWKGLLGTGRPSKSAGRFVLRVRMPFFVTVEAVCDTYPD